MIREIKGDDYKKEVIGNQGPVLLLAYAPWCGDSQRILPVFETISCLPEYSQVCFLRMDVDKNPRSKEDLQVERYPTLCLFKDGRKAAEKVAEVSAEEQKAMIESLLRK